ncbi:MAG: exonuclease SbcCD subunit D [Lachnospiraceae bacterium]|nr:exonuclease SbcCD subunit D [Lachnospiraceae bacterium]
MKLIHTGDLHIGRGMHEFSLIEDQRYILEQLLAIIRAERADALLIAGDVYDRPVPSAEAVRLLDWFLTELYRQKVLCFIVSGNHDSGDRLEFAGKILEDRGLYIAGGTEGQLRCIRRTDAYGELCIWLLPFVRSSSSRETVQAMLGTACVDPGKRNILVTHYFVTDGAHMPELSDSEQPAAVGGIDFVPAEYFSAFDYTALGHLHRAQRIGDGQVWYSGSPLKYSFSESLQEKSVQVVELGEKGTVLVEQRPLVPLHDVRTLKGKLKDLISGEVRALADPKDYIRAVLTDEQDLLDPVSFLRGVYPNVCEVVLERHLKDGCMEKKIDDIRVMKSDGELFSEFYETVTGGVLTGAHRDVVRWMLDQAKEEEA